MTTLEILTKVKALINRPNRWTKNIVRELDVNGNEIAYCIVGGINKICLGAPYRVFGDETILQKVARALRFKGDGVSSNTVIKQMIDWNNNPKTTYTNLMTRIDKGITRCRSKYGHRDV